MKLIVKILSASLLASPVVAYTETSNTDSCRVAKATQLFLDSFEVAAFPHDKNIPEATILTRFKKVPCGYLDKVTGLIWTADTYSCSSDPSDTVLKIGSNSCKARVPSAQELVTIMDWAGNPVYRLNNPEPLGGVTVTKTKIDGKTIGFQTYSGKRFDLKSSDFINKRYVRFIVNS